MNYTLDLFKKLFQLKNLGSIIFLVASGFVVLWFFRNIGRTPQEGLIIGICVYLISLWIAISPLGDWYLRRKCNARKIEDPAMQERLLPLLAEVYAKAVKLEPELHEDISLYIVDDKCINAFAVGRRTICLTTGMLQAPDDVIKAVLSHEFGHLANKDTDILLMQLLGNIPILTVFTIANAAGIGFGLLLCQQGVKVTQSNSNIEGVATGCMAMIIGGMLATYTFLFVKIPQWIWIQFHRITTTHSGRLAEYEADLFACNLGYGEGLKTFLEFASQQEHNHTPANFVTKMMSSHPSSDKRLEYLKTIIG